MSWIFESFLGTDAAAPWYGPRHKKSNKRTKKKDKKSKRYVEYQMLKQLVNVAKKGINKLHQFQVDLFENLI